MNYKTFMRYRHTTLTKGCRDKTISPEGELIDHDPFDFIRSKSSEAGLIPDFKRMIKKADTCVGTHLESTWIISIGPDRP